MDLFWSYNHYCPTLQDYYQMVDNSELLQFSNYQCCLTLVLETGQLLFIAYNLMASQKTLLPPDADTCVETFILLLGRYYQIRDDYQNLKSPDVSGYRAV
jgi:geranylgeranyl pyrophosphate synthase